MPSRTHIAVQLVSWCAVLAAAAPSSAAKGGTAAQVIQRLNHERARAGLAPLSADRRLSNAAARQARRQLRTGFGHAGNLGAGRSFRRVAELIARQRGWRLDTASVTRDWRKSAPHRSLIETSSYRLVGVGWARGRLNGSLATIWTVRLGAR